MGRTDWNEIICGLVSVGLPEKRYVQILYQVNDTSCHTTHLYPHREITPWQFPTRDCTSPRKYGGGNALQRSMPSIRTVVRDVLIVATDFPRCRHTFVSAAYIYYFLLFLFSLDTDFPVKLFGEFIYIYISNRVIVSFSKNQPFKWCAFSADSVRKLWNGLTVIHSPFNSNEDFLSLKWRLPMPWVRRES